MTVWVQVKHRDESVNLGYDYVELRGERYPQWGSYLVGLEKWLRLQDYDAVVLRLEGVVL